MRASRRQSRWCWVKRRYSEGVCSTGGIKFQSTYLRIVFGCTLTVRARSEVRRNLAVMVRPEVYHYGESSNAEAIQKNKPCRQSGRVIVISVLIECVALRYSRQYHLLY